MDRRVSPGKPAPARTEIARWSRRDLRGSRTPRGAAGRIRAL